MGKTLSRYYQQRIHRKMKTQSIRVNYALFFVVLLFISCTTRKETTPEQLNGKKQVTLINKKQTPVVEESVFVKQKTKYALFLKQTENTIGITSSKAGPLNRTQKYHYANYGSTYNSKNKYYICLNDMPLLTSPTTRAAEDNGVNVFGEAVSLTISKTPMTRAGETGSSVSLYVPKEIEILSPSIEGEEDLLPLCYYDNFRIEWNGDEDNDNGVVLILEWTGDKVIGVDYTQTNIRRTCVVEDTGSYTFDKNIFDGIPDTAVCHLTILRGDLDVIDYNDESFKIMAETHEFLTFILIKNITVLP